MYPADELTKAGSGVGVLTIHFKLSSPKRDDGFTVQSNCMSYLKSTELETASLSAAKPIQHYPFRQED